MESQISNLKAVMESQISNLKAVMESQISNLKSEISEVIVFENVSKFYGEILGVNRVNLTLTPGITSLVGPNGSGKTTTAKLCTGLIDTSAGAVRFDGRTITDDLIAFRRRLGYVPEEPHLYSFQSGREYLQLVGRLRELPSAVLEPKIDTLLELFGLSSAANQSIASYSKGMKQKLLIIAALLHDPDVLIFDEPDSGLDVTTTLILRHLVRALAARGKAILYSSHILEIVEKLCDRVIVLHRGRIVADDSVANLQHLMTRHSLEEVFAQLVLRDDPERTARDIADVVAADA
jgi:ABC-2 type transport system ATP-binding protein